jgi:predicted DNA-binding protein
MPKKGTKKIAAKGDEQYMLRLPPGLRDQVARRATENGRSMNTEIVEAIEKHLRDADRVTQLWDIFEKHRKNIEDLDLIGAAIENLELAVTDLTNGEFYGRLSRMRMTDKESEEQARKVGIPPITAEEAAGVREWLEKTGIDKAKFLDHMGVSSIEEIRNVERAKMVLLGLRRRLQATRRS